MKRTKLAAALALAASLTLTATGCGGPSGSDTLQASSGGEPSGTITLWARDSQKGFMDILADAYNKSHKAQVQVTIVPSGNFVQKFGTATAGGSGPDVASIDLVYLPYFASTGVLQDITDEAFKLPYKDKLSPSHARLSTWEDKTYALPFTAEASVLFYNKELFQKAGLDPAKPPANYEEILSAAKKIRALGPDTYGFTMAGQCGGCNIFEFTPSVWASGGDVLSADGKTAKLDSPEVTKALTFYKQMHDAGVMPEAAKTDSGTAQPALFQAGKVGMVVLGAFFTQTLNTDKKIDYGIAPIPGENGGSASFAGGDNIAVTTGSKNKPAAWDFVKWATGDEAQTLLAKNSIVPVRTDLVKSVYASADPRNEIFSKALETGKTPYSVVENKLFNDNNGPWATMINEAVFGGDVQAAQQKAQQAAQQIIQTGP
ncbi:ABC transporter substrate-binding protein [Pseudarthrobacter sp. LMD1-1-1.1]|uniref:ABC transporter substrate-binding protein n=1 Tax=Pseudarthrobacter sp. LMD1-1-1.1 TaxID=3135242 RepID=UPI003426E265